MHKAVNVLAKLPKAQQPKAKRALQEIWMAETKIAAEAAFDTFIESYELKYPNASPKTAMHCWCSTTSRLSTGSI